jgi:hypothetical protein
MPDWFERAKGWVNRITELGLAVIALGLVLEILFGRSVPFIGGSTEGITGNLTDLVGSLGDNGLVGLIALAIVLWLFQKRNPG